MTNRRSFLRSLAMATALAAMPFLREKPPQRGLTFEELARSGYIICPYMKLYITPSVTLTDLQTRRTANRFLFGDYFRKSP
jgi:hypothetical protein